MRSLRHPRCIRMLEKGNKGQITNSFEGGESGFTYIVMEYIKGESLFDFMVDHFDEDGLGEQFGKHVMH